MIKALVFGLLMVGVAGHAEEKTCVVKGMHCAECAADVKQKVCEPGKYKTCDTKVISEKKKIGQLHMITSDPAVKIDEGAVNKLIAPFTYELGPCKDGKAST